MKLASANEVALVLAREFEKENPAFMPQPSRFLREINAGIHPPERRDRVLLPFMSEREFPTMEGGPILRGTSTVYVELTPVVTFRNRKCPLIDEK